MNGQISEYVVEDEFIGLDFEPPANDNANANANANANILICPGCNVSMIAVPGTLCDPCEDAFA